MCGIVGWVAASGGRVDADAIARALRVVRHRGPDDAGIASWNGEGVVTVEHELAAGIPSCAQLGHRRLSILDLGAGGWQPMRSPDGRYTIVYNGEIYNYVELRSELQRSGVRFRTGSDTEVLLHALVQWDLDALTRLVGMFAFALWDRHRGRLLLARDFFGIKPLYYTAGPAGATFASELKALLELPGVSRKVNPGRLYRYLTVGLADDTGETMLAGVNQLPAAHYLEYWPSRPDHAPEPVRYWRVDTSRRSSLSFRDASEALRELFLESVRLHLRSDVPVGAALSGGIDSSAIVMAMRHLEPSLEIHAFSYAADDERISEERWIDLVGAAAGAIVHKTRPDERDLVADLDQLIAIQDEPFGSTSIYAQHRVFRLAQENDIKVMLDGQGADELLAGYSNFLGARVASLFARGEFLRALRFASAASRLPHARRGELLAQAGGYLLPPGVRPLAKRVLYATRKLAPSWLRREWFVQRGAIVEQPARRGRDERLRAMLADSVEQGLASLLRYEDRNSMAHSVESRVPFLTPRIADFVLSLPEEFILADDGTSKAVFREAMRGIVPDAVLDRRDKIGFSTPERRWLTRLAPWVDEVLASDTARRVHALDVPAMQREWRAIQDGRSPFDWRVWRWINLIRWAELRDVSFE